MFCPSVHLNFGQVSTQKLYMIALSYFQGRSILHESWVLSCYSDCLTFSLKNMTFTMKILFGPLLRNYKWQQLHVLWSCQADRTCALQSHFELLTFDLDLDIMTITIKILSGSLLSEIYMATALYLQDISISMSPLHCGVILNFQLYMLLCI